MKKIILSIVGIIAFIGFAGIAQSFSNYGKQTDLSPFVTLQDIIKNVKGTGAVISGLQVRVKVEDAPFHDAATAANFRQKVSEQLGVHQWTGTGENREQDMVIYRGDAVTGAGIPITLYQVYGQNYRSDLTISFNGKEGDQQKIRGFAAVLDKLTKSDKANLQIYTCVTGKFNGKLKNDLQREKIFYVINKSQGKIVESVVENTVISISAYSPQIPFEIKTNRKPMNLQVATHVDDFRQETILTVGTPIITTEY